MALYDHYSKLITNYEKTEGFVKIKTNVNAENLSYNKSISLFDYDSISNQAQQDVINCFLRDAAMAFAKSIIDNFAVIDAIKHHERNELILRASVNVVKGSNTFLSLGEEAFVVNGARFSEEELIEAVKQTYPERVL